MRKFFCILVILFVGLNSVFSMGMPVIDISSITTAIGNFAQTLKQYEREIAKWKDEYDRLAKAAKDISSGDYTTVIKGIARMAGQISDWGMFSYFGETNLDDALSNVQAGSYDLLKISRYVGIGGMASIFSKNQELLNQMINRNITLQNLNLQDGVDTKFNNASAVMKYLSRTLTDTAGLLNSSADLSNNVIDLFTLSPEETKQILESAKKYVLEDFGGSNEGLNEQIKAKQQELIKYQNDLIDINSAEEPTLYNRTKDLIDQVISEITTLQQVQDWVNGVDQNIININEKVKASDLMVKNMALANQANLEARSLAQAIETEERKYQKFREAAINSGFVTAVSTDPRVASKHDALRIARLIDDYLQMQLTEIGEQWLKDANYFSSRKEDFIKYAENVSQQELEAYKEANPTYSN